MAVGNNLLTITEFSFTDGGFRNKGKTINVYADAIIRMDWASIGYDTDDSFDKEVFKLTFKDSSTLYTGWSGVQTIMGIGAKIRVPKYEIAEYIWKDTERGIRLDAEQVVSSVLIGYTPDETAVIELTFTDGSNGWTDATGASDVATAQALPVEIDRLALDVNGNWYVDNGIALNVKNVLSVDRIYAAGKSSTTDTYKITFAGGSELYTNLAGFTIIDEALV
jgi:hypothetical protein